MSGNEAEANGRSGTAACEASRGDRAPELSGDQKGAGSDTESKVQAQTQERGMDGQLISLEPERVLYPRSSRVSAASRTLVVGGCPITNEQAIELRQVIFGSASCPPRGEWLRTALSMRTAGQNLAYGLCAPRNSTRSLLSSLQSYIMKYILFDIRDQTMGGKNKKPSEILLRPEEECQQRALINACTDIIWRCGGGEICKVALPQETSYITHSQEYYHDGITEKLQIFEFKNQEDLYICIKRYLHLFEEEPGAGALLLLYAAVLSRGPTNVRTDLDGKSGNLLSTHVEGSLNIVTLLVTGRATPYLHNGVLYVGDEDHYALPQFGILARSNVGILVWYGSEDSSQHDLMRQPPGSRLKTPAFPIWVTCCAGHYGIMFNTNRELLRNYHAERRFDLHYYTCGGCYVLLSVDTRGHDAGIGGSSSTRDDINATPLEKLIHSKWQDAKVTWTGPTPYVGEQAAM